VKGSLHAKNQLDSSSHFNTIPACGRQTDRQTMTAYTALAQHCAVKTNTAGSPSYRSPSNLTNTSISQSQINTVTADNFGNCEIVKLSSQIIGRIYDSVGHQCWPVCPVSRQWLLTWVHDGPKHNPSHVSRQCQLPGNMGQHWQPTSVRWCWIMSADTVGQRRQLSACARWFWLRSADMRLTPWANTVSRHHNPTAVKGIECKRGYLFIITCLCLSLENIIFYVLFYVVCWVTHQMPSVKNNSHCWWSSWWNSDGQLTILFY